MGSVYQRGRIWWIKYYDGGRPMRESSRSERKSDAQRLLKEREGAVVHGDPIPAGWQRVTFDDLAELVLRDYRLNERKSTSRAANSIKRLRSYFGKMRLPAISAHKIDGYVLRRRSRDGVKNATINRELAALRRGFALAVQAGIYPSPRVPRIRLLSERNVRQGFFTTAEYLALRNAAPDHLRPVIVLAYYTGMRRGELLGLRWEQVALDERRLYLGTDTKNGRPRTIPLAAEPVAQLRAHKQSAPTDHPWVFTYRGRKLKDFRGSWAATCDAVGLEGRIFHDLRRTAVRNVVRAGIPETVAMAISGHRTRSVFDRYNITSDRDLERAASQLDAHVQAAANVVAFPNSLARARQETGSR